MKITSQDRRDAWVACADAEQVEMLRKNFNVNVYGLNVHVFTNNKRTNAALVDFVSRWNRSVARVVRQSPETSAAIIADKYIPRAGVTRVEPCRCKSCGETGSHRFTTLPMAMQLCDDCA